jgi:ABC-2 type transport system ATP-binding protein
MIRAEKLTKQYRSARAVQELSFTVEPGRVTGFLGPNGAGKSTTIRMILGLDTPSAGQALVNGRAYRSLRHPLREVGALLDAASVHGGRTARNHLRYLAVSNDLPAGRVEEALDRAGLSGVAGQRIGGFSLGMRQRLGVAAALLGDPGILIFDEPVNGLDPEGISWIRHLMRSLAAEGRTVFVSSHLISEMALTADHLIVIGRGRLIADADLAGLLRSSALDDVLVRSPQADRLADLLRDRGAVVVAEPDGALGVTGLSREEVSALAAAHGIAVHELVGRSASLEQAYLKLTDHALQYRTTEPLPSLNAVGAESRRGAGKDHR